MAPGLFEKPPQCRKDPYRGYSYPLRAPAETPVGNEDFKTAHNGIDIVQRLSHPHENRICKHVGLVHRDILRHYFGSIEIPPETAAPGHAERTVHLAAVLGRNAQSSTVRLRNHYGFHGTAARHRENIFFSTVRRPVNRGIFRHPDFIILRQPFPELLRQVRHIPDVAHLLFIQPVSHLFCNVKRRSVRRYDILQFI